MISTRSSIATRLALGYGLIIAASIALVSAAFYFGTIGLLNRSIDGKIDTISDRLLQAYGNRPRQDLVREIARLLSDGIDSDTEVYLLVSPEGRRLVGNLSTWPGAGTPLGTLITHDVIREGRPSPARIIVRRMPDGALLYVGRDMQELLLIRSLVTRALVIGAALSLVLVIASAWFLRRQIERRIGSIRHAAHEVGAGDLSKRVPSSSDDEFGRLGADINRMLDQIEHLMDGVRHVSNAIAHDLRTPMSRIRSRLEEAVRRERGSPELLEAAQSAIQAIDEVILVFEKLLQIAQAESGVRTKTFETVDLNRIARDMVELYDAAAEENSVALSLSTPKARVLAAGDHDLLASAVASLIDNAIKYAGPEARVEVGALDEGGQVAIWVRDNGPGIPDAELPRVTERFYRLDRSRSLPGHGLGLSIVLAIARLHGGTLRLDNERPGLVASIVLPATVAAVAAKPQAITA